MRELHPPEGSSCRRLPIKVHPQSRECGWQQVAVLPLGLHRDDVCQERSRPVRLLRDAEVRARQAQVLAVLVVGHTLFDLAWIGYALWAEHEPTKR